MDHVRRCYEKKEKGKKKKKERKKRKRMRNYADALRPCNRLSPSRVGILL
jgi:hypothetical protein